MGTFSINIGLTTESKNYPVEENLNYLLSDLPDNEDKLITPISLRNSFLSLWTSVPFKETITGPHSYISLDSTKSLAPNAGVTASKILMGKRSFQSNDIMSEELLDSDIDIFFYNTKLDTISNTATKIAFLAGNSFSLFPSSPYIQSERVSGITQSSLSLDIVSKSGNLSLTSGLYATFSINSTNNYSGSIYFPTRREMFDTSSINNKVLLWKGPTGYGKLVWDELKLPTTDHIGTTGSELNIYGTPVNVNGYSLELDDTRYVPSIIGDIGLGSTFSNISISEVLRKMIYTYLPPVCTLSIDSKYAEVGTYPVPILSYSITKRTLSTIPTSLTNMLPGLYPEIVSTNQVVINGTSSGIVISPISATHTYFTITVSDGTASNSNTESILGIYPYFYGFSPLSLMNITGMASLTKKVEYKADMTIDITGSGNFYFIYDSDYGTMLSPPIINGIVATYSNRFLSSPTGLWSVKEFIVYQWNDVSQIGPPSQNYDFRYNLVLKPFGISSASSDYCSGPLMTIDTIAYHNGLGEYPTDGDIVYSDLVGTFYPELAFVFLLYFDGYTMANNNKILMGANGIAGTYDGCR